MTAPSQNSGQNFIEVVKGRKDGKPRRVCRLPNSDNHMLELLPGHWVEQYINRKRVVRIEQ